MAEVAVREREVRVDGAVVRLLEAGDPAAPPLLFLHGWGLGPRCYADGVLPLTRAGLRVLAPALPGFAGSDGPALSGITLEAYASRVARLLEVLELDQPAFVVGHSFGGGVALQLAAERPDLVRSLTLVNPVGGADGAPPSWLRWAVGALAELDPGELVRSAPGLVRDLVPNLLRKPLTLALTARLALTASLARQAEALVAAGLPVLFVWSDGDRILAPGALAAVAEALPQSALPAQVLRGRHGWLLARPHDFAELVHSALVLHALLERRPRRAGGAVVLPHGSTLADLLRHGQQTGASVSGTRGRAGGAA